MTNNQPQIVNCGLGVDSIAMLLGLHDNGERPAAILFADVGVEKPETYEYLPVINAWLRSKGWPEVTVVRRYGENGQFGEHSRPSKTGRGYKCLAGNCTQNKTLPSLAFRGHGCSLKWKAEVIDKYLVETAKGPAYVDFEGECRKNSALPSLALRGHTCSIKWKAEAIDKALAQALADCQARGVKPVKVIGYDDSCADRKRSGRVVNVNDDRWDYRYPLQEWGWARRECVERIQAEGLPVPLKSACYFCPASKKWEILWLAAAHPELVTRALEIEDLAQPHLKHPFVDNGQGRCSECDEDEAHKVHHTSKGPVEKRTVQGLGSCGSFAWRAYFEAEGIIEPGGYDVIADPADLDRRWRELATDDNALDGRTVESPKSVEVEFQVPEKKAEPEALELLIEERAQFVRGGLGEDDSNTGDDMNTQQTIQRLDRARNVERVFVSHDQLYGSNGRPLDLDVYVYVGGWQPGQREIINAPLERCQPGVEPSFEDLLAVIAEFGNGVELDVTEQLSDDTRDELLARANEHVRWSDEWREGF